MGGVGVLGGVWWAESTFSVLLLLRAALSELEGSTCFAASSATSESVFAVSANTCLEIVVRSVRKRRNEELLRRRVEIVRRDS